MTQSQLDRAVAHATGESLGTVSRHGFSIVNLAESDFDEDDSWLRPSVIDWDDLDAERSRGSLIVSRLSRHFPDHKCKEFYH